MSIDLRNKYFTASREYYGSNSVKYMNIELDFISYDYNNASKSFDWGYEAKEGAVLLASSMLNKIATPTVARVYANKYADSVLRKLENDSWKMEAIEIVHWINKNTDYKIELPPQQPDATLNQDEENEKEKRRIQREKEFQQKVQQRLKEREKNEQKAKVDTPNIVDTTCKELKIKIETLAKFLGVSIETVTTWKSENKMPKLALKSIEFYKAGIILKEKNNKLKAELDNLQQLLVESQNTIDLSEIELNNYKKFINAMDIPLLYKKFKDL